MKLPPVQNFLASRLTAVISKSYFTEQVHYVFDMASSMSSAAQNEKKLSKHAAACAMLLLVKGSVQGRITKSFSFLEVGGRALPPPPPIRDFGSTMRSKQLLIQLQFTIFCTVFFARKLSRAFILFLEYTCRLGSVESTELPRGLPRGGAPRGHRRDRAQRRGSSSAHP